MIRHFENITVNYPPTLRDEWVSRSNNMKIFKDQPVWVQKMIERRVLDTGRDVSYIDPEDSISVLFIMRDTPEGHYAWVVHT